MKRTVTEMAEYIERGAAIERFTFKAIDCFGMEPTISASNVRAAIAAIPAADVVPVVRGKWLEYDDTEYFRAKCSLCGNWIDTRCGTNFCPNCGARMDGDGEWTVTENDKSTA